MTVPEMGRSRRLRSGERDSGSKTYHSKRRRLDDYEGYDYQYSSRSRDLSRRNPSRHDAYFQNSRDNSSTSYKYPKYTSRKRSDSDSRRRHRHRQRRNRSKSSDLVSALNCMIRNLFCLIRVTQGFEFHHTCVIR